MGSLLLGYNLKGSKSPDYLRNTVLPSSYSSLNHYYLETGPSFFFFFFCQERYVALELGISVLSKAL